MQISKAARLFVVIVLPRSFQVTVTREIIRAFRLFLAINDETGREQKISLS
jgi:hypothetical protein